MGFTDRLRQASAAIAARWNRDVLATYPEAAARALERQHDPFANPMGQALRTATHAVVEGLVKGHDPCQIASALDEVIQIRAVQGFPPSRAVAFVFLLQDAIRAELGPAGGVATFPADLAELDRRIDQVALGAFDIYCRYRDRINEVKLNQVKRSVGKIAEQLRRRSAGAEADEESPAPPCASALGGEQP